MWVFLASLNPWFSYSLLVLAILSIVIISIFGRLRAKIGDKDIGIGADENKNDKNHKKEDTKDSFLPPTVVVTRSCSDCVKIQMAMREKTEFRLREIEKNILKNQMNFCEQKLIEVDQNILSGFIQIISKKYQDKEEIEKSEIYDSVRGLLNEILERLKNEIRRSFKENGFYEYRDRELEDYLEGRIDLLRNIACQHYDNRYPSYKRWISLDDLGNLIENNFNSFKEIYMVAKEIKRKSSLDINEEINKFTEELDTFIQDKE